jgi:hypothetical protein
MAQVISRVSVAEYPVLSPVFPISRIRRFISVSRSGTCARFLLKWDSRRFTGSIRACPHQEDRWRELESLYGQYLNCLENAGLADANAARIASAKASFAPPNIRSVIVAGVPDLNRISQRYLENLEAMGVAVTVLVDAPDCDEARFDPWGRPAVETWPQRTLPLPLEDIVVAADPSSEADIVASLLGPDAVAAICAADADIIPFHDRALHQHGLNLRSRGENLLRLSRCATLSRLWLLFC